MQHRARGQRQLRAALRLQPPAEGLIVIECAEELSPGNGQPLRRDLQLAHGPGQISRQRLPEGARAQAVRHRQQAAEMVLMDMGGRHHIDVVHAPQGEILVQGDAASAAALVLLRLGTAAVDHHDECAARKGRVRTLQDHGFAIAHIDKSQLQFFHRRQPMARLM